MSDLEHIPNWQRIDDRLTTSGQLTTDAIPEIALMGTRFVINLAPDTHERALAGEAEAVAASGMAYIHIPVAFDAPTEEDCSRFCASMEKIGTDPVHVHCIVNAQVSAFVYRYRRDVLGVSEKLAREAMERLWQPGGVWAAFIGDEPSIPMPHRAPRREP